MCFASLAFSFSTIRFVRALLCCCSALLCACFGAVAAAAALCRTLCGVFFLSLFLSVCIYETSSEQRRMSARQICRAELELLALWPSHTILSRRERERDTQQTAQNKMNEKKTTHNKNKINISLRNTIALRTLCGSATVDNTYTNYSVMLSLWICVLYFRFWLYASLFFSLLFYTLSLSSQ